MIFTHTTNLNLFLPPNAKRVYVFTHLVFGLLISIFQLCDSSCEAHFIKNSVKLHTTTKLYLTMPVTKTFGVSPLQVTFLTITFIP